MRSVLIAVLIGVVSVGVCGADEHRLRVSDHVEPCDVDIVILDGSPTRSGLDVSMELPAITGSEAPRLVWHCGTPEPPPPTVEALTTAVDAVVRFRAPPPGWPLGFGAADALRG